MAAAEYYLLQCGRIYKDAEIGASVGDEKWKATRLQCGRIYKDAEIGTLPSFAGCLIVSFNVAASIKMRKLKPVAGRTAIRSCFNVAASIKMRKSNRGRDVGVLSGWASMWPHL